MSKIFGQNIDLNKNEAKNFRLGNELTYPTLTAPDSGYLFFHSANKKFYGWTGTDWLDLTSAGSGPSTITWSNVTGKPSTFAPSAHNHAAGDINSGTLNINRIPTGLTVSTVSLGNHSHIAANLGFTPFGSIASENVQDAIEEVMAEASSTGVTQTTLSFVPNVKDNGTAVYTYDIGSTWGRLVKTGKQITFNMVVKIDSVSGTPTSQSVVIEGIPYNARDFCVVNCYNLRFFDNISNPSSLIAILSGNQLSFAYTTDDVSNASSPSYSDILPGSSSLFISGTYFTV